jgi:hypothetical protein
MKQRKFGKTSSCRISSDRRHGKNAKAFFYLPNLIRDEAGEESEGFFDLTAVEESLRTLLLS